MVRIALSRTDGKRAKRATSKPKSNGSSNDGQKDLFEGVPRHVVQLDVVRNQWRNASRFGSESETYAVVLDALHTAWALTGPNAKPRVRELAAKWLNEVDKTARRFLRELAGIYGPGKAIGVANVPAEEHRAGSVLLIPNAGSARPVWLELEKNTIDWGQRQGWSWDAIAQSVAMAFLLPGSPFLDRLPEQTRKDSVPQRRDALIAKARAAVERVVRRCDQNRPPDSETIIIAVARALGYPKPEHLFDAKAAAEKRAAKNS